MKLFLLTIAYLLSLNSYANPINYSKANAFLKDEKNFLKDKKYRAIIIPSNILPDLELISSKYTSDEKTCGTFKAYNNYVDAYIKQWDFFNELRIIEKTKLNDSNFLDSNMRLEIAYNLRSLNIDIDFLEFDRKKLKKRKNMYCSKK